MPWRQGLKALCFNLFQCLGKACIDQRIKMLWIVLARLKLCQDRLSSCLFMSRYQSDG